MTMTEWARREVEIACKRENPDRKEGEWDYGCACYESALKAYECLAADGHSGMSWGLTRAILIRLMDGKALTPITDNEEDWGECHGYNDNNKHYQCKRMSSLFKDVYSDGTIKYKDVNRATVCYLESPNSWWHSGLISNMIHEMFPITMPYIPEDKPYRVYAEQFLYKEGNGDYDTEGILYCVKPDGEKIDIYKYFGEVDGKFVEISFEEYEERKKNRVR